MRFMHDPYTSDKLPSGFLKKDSIKSVLSIEATSEDTLILGEGF